MTTDRTTAKRLNQACRIGGLALLTIAVSPRQVWAQNTPVTNQERCEALFLAIHKAGGDGVAVYSLCKDNKHPAVSITLSSATLSGVQLEAAAKTSEGGCIKAKGRHTHSQMSTLGGFGIAYNVQCQW